MRYRMAPDGSILEPATSSGDVVVGTVWFTLLVGVIFIVAGVRGRQRWLQFWGGLTCVSCAVYFAWRWSGASLLPG
ncbi:MAG: hypothetical protein ACU85V_15945 [Gammaproteobacteria bacterium]